jgi:glycosyltransferase involved in cell wall biosynthesis
MKITVAGTRGFPNVQGGIEKHCEKLYTHLAEKGLDIIVFTRAPYTTPDMKNYKGVTLIPVNCPRNKFLEAIVHTFKCVIKARKLRPDILHIHAIGPSLFAPFARVLGLKVLVTSHGPDYMRKKWSFPAKLFLRLCELAGMTFAHKIIAISQNIADDIKRKFKREPAVIPNGIEIPNITSGVQILKKFGLNEKKYILAVGRFVPEKGFHDLIEAFNNDDFKDLKLVIAGDADHEDNYSRNLKNQSRNNENIVLTGLLSEQPLQQLYNNAALFVLPSYYEGLPIVLLEAMSYGLPCIASDIPANQNVPLGGDNFFKAGDIESISAKMHEFINEKWTDEEKNSQINTIYQKYNWNKIANDTLKVYRNITK